MRNIVILQSYCFNMVPCETLGIWIDEFSKMVVILDINYTITIFSYEKLFMPFNLLDTIELLELLPKHINIQGNTVKQIFFKSENNEILIFLKSGLLIKVNIEKKNVETITLFTDEILSVEISPSLEYIVFATRAFKLYLFNNDLELIKSGDLDDNDCSDKINDGSVCNEASISWRGDNQFFAVLFTINNGRKCLIRDTKLNVFKSPARADNLIVFSMSEAPVKNLSNIVSWMPSGSLIAYFQNDKKHIIFSEKNGLKHGEFEIKNQILLKQEKPINSIFIKWNIDLPIICNILEYNENQHILNIYYRSNYDWQLKYSKIVDRVKFCKFSESQSLRLFILFENGNFNTIDFKMEYHNSISNNNYNEDNGTIAVFSDFKIKFTPLGSCNIPPPMFLKAIDLQNNPPFTFYWWKNLLFVTGMNSLTVISNNNQDDEYNVLQVIENKVFDENIKFFIFQEVKGENKGYFYLIKTVNDTNFDLLVQVRCNFDYNKESEMIKILSTDLIKIERSLGIFPSTSFDNLFDKNFFEKKISIKALGQSTLNLNQLNIQSDLLSGLSQTDSNSDSSFYLIFQQNKHNLISKVNTNIHSSFNINSIVQTSISSQYDIVKAKTLIDNKLERVIYLTRNNRLYIDDFMYALDITSFEIYKNFLFLTQTTNNPFNYLHIIDINQGFNLNPNKRNEAILTLNENLFNVRRIERGAFIVTISNINVLIQTPRGNLETFCPRPLVLYEIIQLVEKMKYLEAFELSRKHKINYNFLYDIDPEGFFVNLSELLKQVKKVDYLNLFLNSLENNFSEEVLKIFPELNMKEEFKKLFIINKTNRVCDAMKTELYKLNTNNVYLTSIIHTLTKKTPPEYLNALKLIQNLKIQEKENNSVHANSEKTLEYLCWVVNADVLYDFALKTYDFELVIMVAKHTQKDPKEYLPYLKKLQEMDSILMKFQINYDLKFYEDALSELSKGQEKYFDKCLQVVEKHQLYEFSLKLFCKNENCFLKIWKTYANYLEAQTKFYEAGYAYLESNDYEASLKCFKVNDNLNKKSSSFSEIAVVLKKLNLSFDEMKKIWLELIEGTIQVNQIEYLYHFLRNEGNGRMYTQLQSVILKQFLKSKRWFLAYNLLKESDSPQIKKEFLDEISLSTNFKMNELSRNKNFFEEKSSRLTKVQMEKRSMPQLQNLENKNFDENMSEAGSASFSGKSQISNYSKMTRKAKNKAKLKKVKEGSPLEEDFLINVLKDLKMTQEDIDNTKELITVLNYVGLCEISDELKRQMEDYISTINAAVFYNIAQQDFLNSHPELKELFPNTFTTLKNNATKLKLIVKD